MLARLQQFTTSAIVAIAAFWAWACVRAGHPAWASLGAAAILGGYAVVLGVEFALLRRAHGSDPTPRATAAQLFAAWLGEVRSAPLVFCWRQPFRSRRWPDHLPQGAAGRRGVLLVHGFVCNRGVWNRWLERLMAQGVPFVAVDLEPVFGSIDDYPPLIEAAVRRLELCTGGVAPLVVAHSMGGLALRRWCADAEGNAQRLHHVLTIATPHRGTWLARFAATPATRQMRLGSRWLAELAARESPALARRSTCYYGHCDNIVFPPMSAALPGADNRHLAGVAHVCMVDRPEPWARLQQLLAEPTPPTVRPFKTPARTRARRAAPPRLRSLPRRGSSTARRGKSA